MLAGLLAHRKAVLEVELAGLRNVYQAALQTVHTAPIAVAEEQG